MRGRGSDAFFLGDFWFFFAYFGLWRFYLGLGWRSKEGGFLIIDWCGSFFIVRFYLLEVGSGGVSVGVEFRLSFFF